MPVYLLSEIPSLDPAEFDIYRGAARTGEYFHQTITNETLDTKYVKDWIPIGKTTSSRVMQACQSPCDIAIMYQWQGDSEQWLWFHLLTLQPL